jgi:ABC-type sugar transport system permease subunit
LKFLLLIPSLIFFILFTLWPLVEVFRLSLYKINFITSKFIGLSNYIESFQDPVFLTSIANSFLYAILLVLGISISLFLALYLYHMNKKWQDASRVLLYLPTLSAGIIIALAWKWIFNTNGIVNWILGKNINWFGQWQTAIPVISFIVISASFGSNTIVLLSAIQNINKDLIEAARIDGASWWQIIIHIILPIISPTIYMIIIMTILSAFMIVENIMMLAPYDYSATVTYSIYTKGFMFSKYGLAAAQAVILLIISIVLYIAKKKWEKQV